MEKYAILVDSGSQIELDNEQNIYVVPLLISIDHRTYKDIVEIKSEDVFEQMERNHPSIKTSQPSTGAIIEVIQKIKEDGFNHIIAITIASGLSSTGEGIELACGMENIPCTLIDTKATAFIQRFIAFKVHAMIQEQRDLTYIQSKCNAFIEHSGTVIMTPNLNHLKHSGRLTSKAALLGSLLKIVPIMFLNKELGGKIDVLDKVRTLKKANSKIFDYMLYDCGVDHNYTIVIQHVGCLDFALEMKALLEQRIPLNIEVDLLPSVVGGHMGIGGLGYQYIKNKV